MASWIRNISSRADQSFQKDLLFMEEQLKSADTAFVDSWGKQCKSPDSLLVTIEPDPDQIKISIVVVEESVGHYR